jgi:hypothetical protein
MWLICAKAIRIIDRHSQPFLPEKAHGYCVMRLQSPPQNLRHCYTACMIWQRTGWKSALLLCAAVCALALPSVVMIKQAQAGELLQMLCTAEGKKAVAGTSASHDCTQCCAGSAPAPAPVVRAAALHGVRYAPPSRFVPYAVLNAAYLTPAATGPPAAQ